MACSVINNTPFQAASFPCDDENGRTRQVIVVKGTWQLSTGRLAAAEHQYPVLRSAAECCLGELELDPTQRKLIQGREAERWTRFEGDYLPAKPNFDIIINAWAQTPHATPQASIECAVDYNDRPLLRLMAHAPRIWRKSLGGFGNPTIEQIAPATRIPLIHAFAFGGDAIGATTPTPAWLSNQNGMGYYAQHKAAHDQPLPWIESPAQPIRQWDDRPAPIALGHCSAADTPRRRMQGSFDDAWQRERAPLPPFDFDPRYYNAAPSALQLPTLPTAGARFSLYHLGKQARLDVRLPAVRIQASAETAGGARHAPRDARWDTLLIEPEEDRYMLIWRTSFTDRATAPLRHIAVHADLAPRS